MKKWTDTQERKENCVLIIVCAKKSDNKGRKESEIESLALSAGLNVIKCYSQNIKEFTKATVLGSGKLEEINKDIEGLEEEIDVAIVDYSLTGSQAKNISDVIGVKVIDRVGLIIDIFATRAKTSEAKLQVKYAQNKYLLPRLNEMKGSSGRFGGAGVGMRGPGESKLELDRRFLENEIDQVKKQIEKIKNQREVTRQNREKNNVPKVALVGYTNAGKSSLLNLLAKENIYADDRLFATLDTTSRKMFLNGKNIILTDTVGFISDLPHQLVDAFASTLEEARDADLILHVVDVANSKNIDGVKEYQKNMEVTDKVLADIDATKNRIIVYNKADLMKEPMEIKNDEVLISTKALTGINILLQKMEEKLAD